MAALSDKPNEANSTVLRVRETNFVGKKNQRNQQSKHQLINQYLT